MPQRPGLSRHQQPPLPLIQMREDHRELRRQDLRCFLFTAHTTSACRIPGSYGLFFCKPLDAEPWVARTATELTATGVRGAGR
jgi:hypothetical protein